MMEFGDDDLRMRFRAIAREDAAAAPDFSRARIDAARPVVRARRAWYSAGGFVAVSAAAALLFIVWPKTPPYPIDLSSTDWSGPTDFLLDTPGSAMLRTVPAIGMQTTSETTTAAEDRGDTSGRDQ
jgi:hypothetical protein